MVPGLLERIGVTSESLDNDGQPDGLQHDSHHMSHANGDGGICTADGTSDSTFDVRSFNHHSNGGPTSRPAIPQRLHSFSYKDVHDLICVGFGPASLAIAVALHDLQESTCSSGNEVIKPKVRFLERQGAFFWHAGMLLPGAKMQISFIKDLATLRDPRSHFTFLNYLQHHDRLVQFSNLGTFLPSRVEFEDYLRWAAGHFVDVVKYGQSVEKVVPVHGGGDVYHHFQVHVRDAATGHLWSMLSRNVVIAVGGRPSFPPMFPRHHTRILHSSEYSTKIMQALPLREKPYSIAVVGSGQSAAEVFNDLHTRYPHASTRLILRDAALRPSDDSPFVNEVFHPEAVDAFYEQPDEVRQRNLARDKATNYSVVRLELLEHLYERLYQQSIRQPDKSLWQHQILASRDVVGVEDADKQVQLTIKRLEGSASSSTELLAVDAVILATGYIRNAHLGMLEECQAINASSDGRWQIDRNYAIKLDRSKVADGTGIWLQGCNEQTHGLADSLLSIVATRSGELVQNIFGGR